MWIASLYHYLYSRKSLDYEQRYVLTCYEPDQAVLACPDH